MNRLVHISLVLAAIGAVAARRNSITNGKRMVCYIGTWAVYRPGDGKFEMEDIDPHLCTHAMYGFTKLENNEITVFDPWGDLTPEQGGGKSGYKKFTDLKKMNPDLKTLIAIGGWNEGSANYSDMARDPSARRTFVKSIVPFLKKYNFDGLDVDWEYPTQRGGRPEDRESFTDLIRELREELDRTRQGFLLTAAVSPNTKTVEIAYNVPEISRHLDFINVMCYDYHGFWEGHEFTGHNTPLYRHPMDHTFELTFNANDTVTYWLEAGLPKEKLVMGMALYGRGFTLANPDENGLYAPTSGGIPQGPYTRQDGIWGYNEICEKYMTEREQWTISIDSHVKAPYAYNGEHWIGYEDVESLYYKAEYARNMDLGGAMVWSLETDDFRGKCHGEKYILTKTIVNTMNGGGMPKIPQRPKVVPPNSPSGSDQPQPETNRPKPPRRTRRTTTTPEYEYYDEDTTTTRRPRRTRRTTTTAAPDYEYPEEEVTTRSPRPTRTSRPPRRTTTAPDQEDYPQHSTNPTTTTGRPRPTRTSRPPRRTTTAPDQGDYPQQTTSTSSSRPSRPTRTARPRPTTESDYEVTERTTRPPGNPSSGHCTEEGIFPEGNCTGFYQCVKRGKGFQKVRQNCPAGTAFNPDIKGCDHADQVPGCEAVVRSAISYRQNGQ